MSSPPRNPVRLAWAGKRYSKTPIQKPCGRATSQPILDLTPVAEEEIIIRLWPDLVAQRKRKIDLMNAHWMDYDRLFTAPYPRAA